MRTEGVRALLARVAAETVYRRLVVFERDLAAPVAPVPSQVTCRYLSGGDLGEYGRLRPGREAQAAERLAAGDRCFGAWLDGRLVAVRWLATERAHIEYLDLTLTLRPGEIYVYDSFVDGRLRRRGIASAQQAASYAALREEGYRCSVSAVLPENRAAARSTVRGGGRPVGRIGYVRLGRWRRTFGGR